MNWPSTKNSKTTIHHFADRLLAAHLGEALPVAAVLASKAGAARPRCWTGAEGRAFNGLVEGKIHYT